MLTCPYNPEHTVSGSRYRYHIVKCKAKHPELVKNADKICPFNASHRMSMDAFKMHLSVCPDRDVVIRSKPHHPKTLGELQARAMNCVQHPGYEATAPAEGEENWDEELEEVEQRLKDFEELGRGGEGRGVLRDAPKNPNPKLAGIGRGVFRFRDTLK